MDREGKRVGKARLKRLILSGSASFLTSCFDLPTRLNFLRGCRDWSISSCSASSRLKLRPRRSWLSTQLTEIWASHDDISLGELLMRYGPPVRPAVVCSRFQSTAMLNLWSTPAILSLALGTLGSPVSSSTLPVVNLGYVRMAVSLTCND